MTVTLPTPQREALQALFQNRQFDAALGHCLDALQHHPHDAELLYLTGNCHYALNQNEQARHYFQQACHLAPENGLWQWRYHTTCPAIWKNEAEIQAYRKELTHYLNSLSSLPFDIALDELPYQMVEPSFYLMYQGENDKEIKSAIGKLFQKSFLRLFPEEMTLKPRKPQPSGKIKLGFLVTEKHEGVFCKLNAGFLNHLNRDAFELSVLCDSPQSASAIGTHIEAWDIEYLILPKGFQEKIHRIQKAQLDVLFHFEVGSDATNYFLPFFGLAPLQISSMGLPTTSGIPALNAFLTSHALETEEIQDFYTETCLMMSTMPTYFYEPTLTVPAKSKADFGLPENQTVYLCPQTLSKLHPAFDQIIAGILAQDPNGEVALLEGPPHITQVIQQRIEHALPENQKDALTRLRFLPRVGSNDFLHLLSLADVMLDPTHVNGGITTQEALAFGVPIITWPGDTFRNRMTFACYAQLGLTEGIVDNAKSYIEKAVYFGTHPEARRIFKQSILENKHRLFESAQALNDLTELLKQWHQEWLRNCDPSHRLAIQGGLW